MTKIGDRQDEIDTAAARWVVRLKARPLDTAERRLLDAWLNESPRHAAAFDEAQERLLRQLGRGLAIPQFSRQIGLKLAPMHEKQGLDVLVRH